MRVGIGQLWQETNTFNPLPTTRSDFEAFGVLRGAEVIERLADVNEPGGFIRSLRAWPDPPELVGLVRLPAWPSGPATAETLAWLLEEVSVALGRAGRLDAVLLALHGALVAEGEPDVEGAVLDLVRRHVGPGVPVVATLDLHANVTRRMADAADALVLYHTAPHVDVVETGERGAEVLRRIVRDGARPTTALVKVPMVVPAERANTQDPASVSYGLREQLQALERDARVLTAGLATVQPWLDVPELGTAVLVTTVGDAALAETLAGAVARDVWEARERYLPDLTPLEDAVRRAHGLCGEGLVVLSDSADATTSGAPGDSNHVLRELRKYEWPRPALVTLVDGDLVAEAARRGVGSEFPAALGGKRDTRFSVPVEMGVKVEGVFEARFVLSGHLGRNLAIDMGPAAVLRAGSVTVVVTTRSGPHFAPELFRAAGADPFGAAVLVAKSPCGFRAAYAGVAREILVVQAPGCAPADFWRHEYRRAPRPLWPWDVGPA